MPSLVHCYFVSSVVSQFVSCDNAALYALHFSAVGPRLPDRVMRMPPFGFSPSFPRTWDDTTALSCGHGLFPCHAAQTRIPDTTLLPIFPERLLLCSRECLAHRGLPIETSAADAIARVLASCSPPPKHRMGILGAPSDLDAPRPSPAPVPPTVCTAGGI